MESWFNRMVVDLHELLCGRCEFLGDLLEDGVLTFDVLNYDKPPRISFSLINHF